MSGLFCLQRHFKVGFYPASPQFGLAIRCNMYECCDGTVELSFHLSILSKLHCFPIAFSCCRTDRQYTLNSRNVTTRLPHPLPPWSSHAASSQNSIPAASHDPPSSVVELLNVQPVALAARPMELSKSARIVPDLPCAS